MCPMAPDRPSARLVSGIGLVPGVELVESPDSYRARVAELLAEPGPPAAVPALDSPALREWLRAGPGPCWPASCPPSDGIVITVRDDELEPAGQLLARCTGRETRRARSPGDAIALAGTADTTATIVAAPAVVRPDFLAALPALAPVAVLTARHLAAASALVLRTVTRPGGGLGGGPATARLDAVSGLSARAAREAVTDHDDLVTIRAHGRECGLLLRDGMICGRAQGTTGPPASGPPASGPLAACEQGQGCFRNGWHGSRIIGIGELGGQVVLVDSCRALRVSDGEFGPSVSLALAALDGSAVAFVASTWLRSQERDVSGLIDERLRAGDPLALAVAAANATLSEEAEAFGPLVVLGDGGLRLTPPRTAPDTGSSGTRLSDTGRSATAARAAPVADRRAAADTMSDLAASCALFRSSAGLRAAVARWPGGDAASYGGVSAAGLQRRLVTELLAEIAADVYSFQEAWPRPLTLVGEAPARCRACGSQAAVGYQFETPEAGGRTLVMEVCPRCTEQREGFAGDSFDWHVEGPDTVHRGAPFTHRLVLRSRTAIPLHGCAGATVRNASFHQVSVPPAAGLRLAPGDRAALPFSFRFPEEGPVSDYHYLKFPLSLNGQVTVLTHPLYLQTP